VNGSRANGSTNDNEPLLRAPSLVRMSSVTPYASLMRAHRHGSVVGLRRIRHPAERARYVLTQLWPGAAVPIMLTATDTQ
jgi:hypothetical protein